MLGKYNHGLYAPVPLRPVTRPPPPPRPKLPTPSPNAPGAEPRRQRLPSFLPLRLQI